MKLTSLFALGLVLFLAGCASTGTTFYLVPDPDGQVGEVDVTNTTGTTTLTKANENVNVQSADKPISESREASNEEIAENLYIKAIVDKNKVYKGEQVTVTYKLYNRLTIASQMSINKLPQYQGFWAEELETASNITFNTEVINGKQFRVGILKKVALFPTQTGKLEVTPFE